MKTPGYKKTANDPDMSPVAEKCGPFYLAFYSYFKKTRAVTDSSVAFN